MFRSMKIARLILVTLPLSLALIGCGTLTQTRFAEMDPSLRGRCLLPEDLNGDPATDRIALVGRIIECDRRALGVAAWYDELRGRR